MLTRRDLLTRLSAMTALLAVLHRDRAVASPIETEASKWLSKTDELTALLRGETLSVRDWRNGLDAFNQKLDLNDLLRDLNFDQLAEDAGFAARGVSTVKVGFGEHDVRNLSFYPKLFAVDQGRAIIPHGHTNMVSAHLVASGRFHLRQYDQVELLENAMLVRPSFEGDIVAGDLSSIGEAEDNVHWFVALEPSHTLDVIVTGLDAAQDPSYDIHNLDMHAAEPDGDLFRVPRLGVAEALAKYG